MQRILYLGTDPIQFESAKKPKAHVIHYPVIKIVPRSIHNPELKAAYDDLDEFTHLLFTSKNAVRVFFQHLAEIGKPVSNFHGKTLIAIGAVTAAHLQAQGLAPALVAEDESQEGVVELLNPIDLDEAYIFMPRSSLSRPILANFFKQRQIRHQACDLYDTVPCRPEPQPDLDQIDEIVFTSPSTVEAFLTIYGKLPRGKKLLAIGPITEQALLKQLYTH